MDSTELRAVYGINFATVIARGAPVTVRLRHVSTHRTSVLRAEHLIGRSPRYDLCINADYISSPHAAIRWNGEGWEIRDLGSTNGTRVAGVALGSGETRALRAGARICFGDESEAWNLVGDEPPEVMAISLETEAEVVPDGDILAIPSSDVPEVVLFRSAQGTWLREDADGALNPVEDRDQFVTLEGKWLFCCPHVVAKTSSLCERLSLRNASLELQVSLDEEHVEATIVTPGGRRSLGARASHYLLLTLARHRISDQSAGTLPSACGWVYAEDLLDELRVSPEQLNLDVFKLRQQFGRLGFASPADVIERRPRTRQLRLGIGDLSIRKV